MAATAMIITAAASLPINAGAGEIRQLFARATVQPAVQVLAERRFVVCDVCPETTELSAPRPAPVAQANTVKGEEGIPAAKTKGTPPLPTGASEFNIYFGFNKYSLKGGEQAKVRSHTQELLAANSIDVKGYTDSKGSKRYNDRLASRRTGAVVSEIRKLGVKREIHASSEGKCCYVSDNPALNRRVEVHLVHEKNTTQGGK